MSSWWALYLKELKETRNLFLFFLVGTVGLDLLVFLSVETKIIASILCGIPVWTTMAVLPFILAHSFSSEWRAGTNYLLLSLPIRTSAVGLCKYAAVLTMGAVLAAVSITGVYLVSLEVAFAADLLTAIGWTRQNILGFTIAACVSSLFLLLGMVSALEGLKFTVKRFRGLVSVGFFVLGLYLYLSFLGSAVGALSVYLGGTLSFTAYSVLAGIVFLILGLYLFERYVEI